MEMLYSFWSDKILVGILKKVCCNNAVVSNILNVFFACFLLFSTLTVMNVHSIIKLLSHWKVTFGFELFYCMRNYSGVNSFVKFYIIHFSMISNVCWHQIKFFQAIDVIKYVVKRYWCKTLLWNLIDHLPLQVWSREPPAGGLPPLYRTVGTALLEQRSPVAAEPQLWEARSDLPRAGVPRAVCRPRAGTGHASGPGGTRAAPFLPMRRIPVFLPPAVLAALLRGSSGAWGVLGPVLAQRFQPRARAWPVGYGWRRPGCLSLL